MLITLSAVTPASSVFVIVPSVINGVGGASALAFAIAALVGIAVALCYAELSSAFPITGGEYAFVARTLGKPVGFALFVLSLVSGVFVLGVIASGAAIYLGAVWPSLSGSWVGIVVVLVTSVVGCLHIRTNAWVTGVFLVIELAAVAVLSVLGFAHAHQPVSTLWTAQAVGDHGVLVSAGAGLMVSYTATALFAYNGYGTAVYYAEETKQATRTIGRAILWSLAITVAAELIPLTGVLLGTPSLQGLVGASDPMSYFLQARGGTDGDDIVSVGDRDRDHQRGAGDRAADGAARLLLGARPVVAGRRSAEPLTRSTRGSRRRSPRRCSSASSARCCCGWSRSTSC